MNQAGNDAEKAFAPRYISGAGNLALNLLGAAESTIEDGTGTALGGALDAIAKRTRDTGAAQGIKNQLNSAVEDCRRAGAAWTTAKGEYQTAAIAAATVATNLENAAHAVATAARDAVPAGTLTAKAGKPSSAMGHIMLIIALVISHGVQVNGRLTDTLNRSIFSLAVSSNEIDVASKQISSSSQGLADSSSDQAASLEQSSASLEETPSMTQRNAENAEAARRLSSETRQAGDLGAEQVQQMSTAMDGIKAPSDNISVIIKTIDEIAFQTNILALNAAVEAARAGEAGMGFAVVADEVRSLAQRCDKAATAISQLESVTQNNAAGAEENASAAHTLASQATILKNVVCELQESADGIDQGLPHRSLPEAQPRSAPAPAPRAANGFHPLNGNGHAKPARAAAESNMDHPDVWFTPDDSFELKSGNGNGSTNRFARL